MLEDIFFFPTTAIDCRALGSKDVDIAIAREVSCEPEMPLKWHACNHGAGGGGGKKHYLYQQYYTRRTLDHMHEVDIATS